MLVIGKCVKQWLDNIKEGTRLSDLQTQLKTRLAEASVCDQ